MSDIEARMREDETFRTAICDWLTANGVDPAQVPVEAKASVTDGKLTIPLIRDEHGRVQVDPDDALKLVYRTVTVPVVVPPTADVKLWLTPTCPTCGR